MDREKSVYFLRGSVRIHVVKTTCKFDGQKKISLMNDKSTLSYF